MAGAAETIAAQEVYAMSMSGPRRLAAMACDQTVSLELQESQREVVFDDYKFAVTEMAATDEDYRDVLDVDQAKSQEIIDGQVCAANREPMVEVVARGEAESQEMARWKPSTWFQAVRDTGDKLNAQRVDELPVGWTRLVPSMDPKKAFRQHPKQAKELGYKEGMMYWQRYSHTGEDTMDTGSHSVDMSDLAIWSGLVKDFFGVEIPEDVPADEWIRHGIELECNAEEADRLVREMRAEYYKRAGVTQERYSVTEYVDQNIGVLEQIFDAYYPPLAHAINSGENNKTMSDLAGLMLQTEAAKKLKPEVRQQLVAITNSEKFSGEAGRTMNSILRYVAVEELRKGLPAFVSGSSKPAEALQDGLSTTETPGGKAGISTMPLEDLNQRMAANLQVGVDAGRSYGGCAGQIELSMEEQTGLDSYGNTINRQGAYGGRGGRGRGGGGGSSSREKHSKDGKINCPECKASVDEKKAKEIEGHLKCTNCKYEIAVCDNNRVVHPSELPHKRREKQAAVAKNVRLDGMVQPVA